MHYLSLSCIDCADIPQMSGLSIFWQIPGFICIGISEIFASITSLEFFYSQAPSNMRSVSQSFNLFTNALGSWLTIPLTLLVNIDTNNEWVASNVDEGHLSNYFFLLAGLMTLALMVFLYLSRGYVYADAQVLDALASKLWFFLTAMDLKYTFAFSGDFGRHHICSGVFI
jgi:dipeptide/tripeptide permease